MLGSRSNVRNTRTPPARGLASLFVAAALTVSAGGSGGCMALTPQLAPTDYAELEKVEDRGEREQVYAENTIYRHELPQGTRYTKGTALAAEKRSWQSLDAVLRSDSNSAAVLPKRAQRLARVFTALTIAAGIVTVAGAAASAREGLDLGSLNGTGGLLLGGGLATVGFGITAGIFYGKMRKGYEQAVDVYNDSLGMRLGILTPKGEYIAPRGALVDEEGRIILEEKERTRASKPVGPVGPEPPPVAAEPAAPEPEPPEPQTPEPAQTPEAAPTEPAGEGGASEPPAEEPSGPTVVEPPGPSTAAKLSLKTR